jgi:hypothetical protein
MLEMCIAYTRNEGIYIYLIQLEFGYLGMYIFIIQTTTGYELFCQIG